MRRSWPAMFGLPKSTTAWYLSFELRRIARIAVRARADLTEMLSDYDLTPASFDVLANLRRSDAPHRKTPSQLASSSMMSTGGMTFRVDKLEEANLVRREPSPDDRRVVHVRLTEQGIQLMDRVIEDHLRREATLLAGFDRDQQELLAGLLAKLEADWPPVDD